MQFIADMCRSMDNAGYLTIEDLYKLSEKEIIDKIKNCEDKYLSEKFCEFQKTNQVFSSKEYLPNKYCIKVKTKIRYIIPLVKANNGIYRINQVSIQSKKEIEDFLSLANKCNHDNYIYFDFEFTPYEKKKPLIKKKTH